LQHVGRQGSAAGEGGSAQKGQRRLPPGVLCVDVISVQQITQHAREEWEDAARVGALATFWLG